MNKGIFIKQLKFSNELVGIFNEFTKFLDSYFLEEENKIKNEILYENYCNFKDKIIKCANKYGVHK